MICRQHLEVLLFMNTRAGVTGRYVGKTVQHPGERNKQHIPDRLFVNLRGKLTVKATSNSAITCHLQESEDCRHLERRKDFKIIARARHSQHLDVLEAK